MTDLRQTLGLTPPARTRFRLPISGLLLFALVVGGGGWLWQAIQEQSGLQLAQGQELTRQIKQLQRSRDALTSEVSSLRREQAMLQGRFDELSHSLSPEQRRQWLANEVAYYLDLAEQHLQLQQDVAPALRLVELADSLLVQHADPGLTLLREALAADRLTLLTAQQLDRVGLSLRLDALKQQATRVTLPLQAGPSQPASRAAPTPPAAGVWEKGWQAFRNLITIRHYDAPVRPLLSDDQRWLLQQSVYLELTQAQLALWRNQGGRYRQSLTDVRLLLKDYAARDAALSAQLAELTQLAAVELPEIPLVLPRSRQALSALKELHPLTVAGEVRP
jgi:uroporphyrin-3 C-methyltransferase